MNVLIFQTAFLGDIILTTALQRALEAEFGSQLKLHWVTTPQGAELLGPTPRIHVLDKRSRHRLQTALGVVESVKRALGPGGRMDVILLAHPSPRTTWIASQIPADRVIGFAEPHRGLLPWISQKWTLLEPHRLAAGVPYSRKLLDLLEPMGIDPATHTAHPCLPPPSAAAVQRTQTLLRNTLHADGTEPILGEDPIGLICPFSNWGTKQWPLERFLEVTRALADSTSRAVAPMTWLVLGPESALNASHSPLLRALSDPQHPHIISLVGKTTLSDLQVLSAHASLVIANDSANIHLASCFQVPTVCVYGPTLPSFGFAPLASRSVIIETELSLPCRPCSKHGPKTCPEKHFQCMLSIETSRVLEAARTLLQAS